MPSPEQFPSVSQPPRLEALRSNPDKEVLDTFTAEQQQEIEGKQQVLSSLAYFVGKDFEIPVMLNTPGGGWYWDQEKNHIKVDPKDLLEKPMDYLRFVICHEAGHRRISRIIDVIPNEVWQQPGFAFMFNALEDCRDNNFVAEAYPRFKEQMIFSYDLNDEEHKAKLKAKSELGHQPKSMQAGFEYIKQWLKEVKGEEFAVDQALPPDVQEVVQKTLVAAQDSWLRYPSKNEADASEELITKYAKKAYAVDYESIWPEFKKLVDKDIKRQMQQKALQKEMKSQEQGLPQELSGTLSPEEKQELEKAMIDALAKSEGKGPVIDLDSLSESLQQKIQEYVDSLPEEVKEELRKKAEEAIQKFDEEINQALQGKLVPAKTESGADSKEITGQEIYRPPELPDREKIKKNMEAVLQKDANVYEEYRREVRGSIVKLEQDLRDIFTRRRSARWESGHRSGQRISFSKVIQEEAKGIDVTQSKAWEKKTAPQEKDYAISVLVDLSGSMRGDNKIDETFKAVIVLAEVLNRLSIKTEILGFNDRLYEYQNFSTSLSREVREKMGGMLAEVKDSGPRNNEKARYNDDGWALEQVSARLARQRPAEKFLIVLSDGKPVPSPDHADERYGLEAVIANITKEGKQKIIGLGIGKNTEHVASYYPRSLANVDVREMASTLAALIKDVIENS